MTTIKTRLNRIVSEIIDIKQAFGREKDEIILLAVSKKRTESELLAAYQAGLRAFGENYLQEALPKIAAFRSYPIEWHFIGPIQSNKCKEIAENFAWVQSVDRMKVLKLLNQYRPSELPRLNVCIQVNISQEEAKAGVNKREVLLLANEMSDFPRLKLQGLMMIGKAGLDFSASSAVFHEMRNLLGELQKQGYDVKMLSMGMSDDYPAAIAEGASCLRLGTAIFGPRN